ncbi:MAG: LrgB family protein [Trueperaceae bacterium]|nr:LrgB family protein [Trueperaceae bacterium]
MAEALFVTLAAFWGSSLLNTRFRHPLTNPVGLSVLALILYIKLTPLTLASYQSGTSILVFLLKPAVVALGYILYQQRRWVVLRGVPLLLGVFAGTITSLTLTPLIARALGANQTLQMALSLKSVTSPIAIDLAPTLGVEAELAVPLIIITGIFGAAFGVGLLRLVGIRDPFVVGLALGVSSHGIGTARAVEEGPLATAVSGLAMSFLGLSTALFAPLIYRFLGW